MENGNLVNKQKASLISDILGARGTPLCQQIVALLELKVDDIRRENDTVPKERLEFNQGKISAYTDLWDTIMKDRPQKRLDTPQG